MTLRSYFGPKNLPFEPITKKLEIFESCNYGQFLPSIGL